MLENDFGEIRLKNKGSGILNSRKRVRGLKEIHGDGKAK